MGAPCCLVVFVRVSPMTSDVEHLRIRSFVSCASREVSLQVSGSFLISSFVFLSLTFKCSSSVLGNSQLSGVSFANVFSQSVAYLIVLLTVSSHRRKFSF